MKPLAVFMAVATAATLSACSLLGLSGERELRFPYGLDEDGTIPAWFVNGPHPASSEGLVCKGLMELPKSPIPWVAAVASDDGKVVLKPPTEKEVGSFYAYVEIYSPVETSGCLSFGFCSSIAVWWNGDPVANERFSYDVRKDWRRAAIQVRRGRNVVMLRIDCRDSRQWGFTVRLTDHFDHPLLNTYAGLPLPADREPFGVKSGERPNPLVHNFHVPPMTGRSIPAERGIWLLGNRTARAMVVLDEETENGLEFDFHDGSVRGGYETFIPEFSRLFVETSRGIFTCNNRMVTRPGGVRLKSDVPGAILQASFIPEGPTKGSQCPLTATVTYFLPLRRNAAVMGVEMFNNGLQAVDGVMLHYSFITRDDRFESVSETDRYVVLRAAGGGRWVAMAVIPSLPQAVRPAFPYRNGMLDTAELVERRAKAGAGVLYPPGPAKNAYVRLTSGVGILEPKKRATSYFFIAGGRTREEATEILKDCMNAGGERLLAEARDEWTRQVDAWTRVKTPDADINDIFTYSRNYLATLPEEGGYVSAGYYQSYDGARIRDTVMCTTGMTIAGQGERAKAALKYLLEHVPPKDGQWDEIGTLLYGLWHYQSFTGDDYFGREYAGKIARWADELVELIGDGTKKPPLIASRTEGFWERPWLGEGYGLAHNAWAVIGLAAAADTLDGREGVAGSKIEAWTTAARICRDTMLGKGPFSFVRDGRLVTRLKMDGSVQTKGPAEPGGQDMPLEPDVEVVVPYLWGGMDPFSDEALKTTAFLLPLWNEDGNWTFGGIGRYNVLSDPDGPTAGPWPFSTLMYARALMRQDYYGTAMRLVRWTATEGAQGYTWPERISMSSARDRDERYKNTILTWPWGEWLNVILRDGAGLHPVKEGLKLEPHLPSKWAGMKLYNVSFRGVKYDIEYEGYGSRIESITLDGNKLDGTILPLKSGRVLVRLVGPLRKDEKVKSDDEIKENDSGG